MCVFTVIIVIAANTICSIIKEMIEIICVVRITVITVIGTRRPTRLPYAKSSKEPSQESDSVEVDMNGWQVVPPNLGKAEPPNPGTDYGDYGDSNNTDDFDHFLDDAANCVGGNDDNNSENTHMSSDTEY